MEDHEIAEVTYGGRDFRQFPWIPLSCQMPYF